MRTFASFDWHGPIGMAHTCAYPHRTPILTARDGTVSLHLVPAAERSVTAEELRFARQLASAAALYVTECERFLVAEPDGSVDRGAV
jgi:hypothetical protein